MMAGYECMEMIARAAYLGEAVGMGANQGYVTSLGRWIVFGSILLDV